jgi:hypothetical protein
LGQPNDLISPHLEYRRFGKSAEERQIHIVNYSSIMFPMKVSTQFEKRPTKLGYWAAIDSSNGFKNN